jgi:hypothetical protein
MATENIITGPFRLAFPEVFTPKAGMEGGKEKFSITMLFPKDNSLLIPSLGGDGVTPIRKLLVAAIKEKWGEDKAKWPAQFKTMDFKTFVSLAGKDGWPIREGDAVEWDGFGGNVFIRAASQYQPGLVNAKRAPIIAKQEVFGGLICRAQVNAYAYDTAGNKGVTLGLNNLQILKDDGTTFGGRSNPAEAFDSFGETGATGTEEAWD